MSDSKKEELIKELESLRQLAENAEGVLEEIETLEAELEVFELDEEALKELEPITKSLKEFAKDKGLDEDLDEETKIVSLKRSAKFSNSGKRNKEDYYATDDELAAIHGLGTLIDLNKEDVYVFTLTSADQQVDRQNEMFTEKALKTMAKLSVDKAFLVDHEWETEYNPGKIFDAAVKDGKLMQKVYLLNDPMNSRYIKNILAGIYNKVSVGFSSKLTDLVCSGCSKSIYDMDCPHMPGAPDEKGVPVHVEIKNVSDYYEVSIVPIPAQKDAGIRRERSKGIEDLANSGPTITLSEAKDMAGFTVSEELPIILFEGTKETEDPITKTDEINQRLENSDTINNSESELKEIIMSEEDKVEKQASASEEEVTTKAETSVEESTETETKVETKTEETKEDSTESEASKDAKENELNTVLAKFFAVAEELKTAQAEFLAKTQESVNALKESTESKISEIEAQVKAQAENIQEVKELIEEAATLNLETKAMQMAKTAEKSTKDAYFDHLNAYLGE